MPVKLEAAWRVWEVGWRHRRLTAADRRTVDDSEKWKVEGGK